MLTGVAVMAFVEQIIVLLVEVSARSVLFGLTVTTDDATTVVQIVAFAFEQGQAHADLI